VFDTRLAAYAAAAGVTVMAGHAARGALVSRDVDIVVFDETLDFDADGNGTNDFRFTHVLDPVIGQEADVEGLLSNNLIAVVDETESPRKAERFGPGGYVPTADMYVEAKIAASGLPDEWEGQSGFLGVQFEIDSSIHYGFIEMSVNQGEAPDTVPTDEVIVLQVDEPLALHLTGVIWEDQPGVRAVVPGAEPGAVPEPVGLGSLALGVAGLAALRRRRTA
jgi:hypothetical protein